MEEHTKEKRDTFSFPMLIGIFAYFSLVSVGMAIFWQTGIWYQNPSVTNIGTAFSIILVASIVVVTGMFMAKRRKLAKPDSPRRK
jgi:hypothetical protein